MTVILGIETSCDETAAAVVDDGLRVRSNVIASQFDLHAKYKGVVPEIAARAHIERLDAVIEEALAKSGVGKVEIDAIAVTNRPGLVGALLIGVTFAKGLAWAWNKPLIGVDHIRAHAYSPWIGTSTVALVTNQSVGQRFSLPGSQVSCGGPDSDGSPHRLETGPTWFEPPFPAIGLVVSGGHTTLYRLDGPTRIDVLGATIDDAAGEAFDKVANILDLGFPGGPAIENLATTGNPRAIDFPRTILGAASLDFSFSGIKTAVLYHVHGPGKTSGGLERLSQAELADIAASFQQAVIDVLVRKTMLAVTQTGIQTVVLGGGVAANSTLRNALADECSRRGLAFRAVERAYCTDNAAMIAALGYHQLAEGDTATLDMDAYASGE